MPQPYSEANATAWLLRAPARVAIVYPSAWPSPAVWSAPPPLRAGVCGYLFETDPPDVAPYALAAAQDGAVIIPAVDATVSACRTPIGTSSPTAVVSCTPP